MTREEKPAPPSQDTLDALQATIQLVAEAQRSRAPIQRLADVVSSYFVPAVVIIAVLTFIVWSIWGPEPRMAHGLVNAVAVLMATGSAFGAAGSSAEVRDEHPEAATAPAATVTAIRGIKRRRDVNMTDRSSVTVGILWVI